MKTLKESLLDDFGSQTKDLKRLQIEEWLEKNNIEVNSKFIINKDYTIDIDEFIYRGNGNFPEYIQFNICKFIFRIVDSGMTSLRGCPRICHDFNCSFNELTTLKGGPVEVSGIFNCANNKLTSLEGCPKKFGFRFDCRFNRLTSLEGAPKKVDGNFDCASNHLTTLKGSPKYIKGNFACDRNFLISLEGGPNEVEGNYDCSENSNLTSLKGAPKRVGGEFACLDTSLSMEAKHQAEENIDCKRICWQ